MADLEDILERFDRAWQRGPRPALANYLLPAGHHQRQALLLDLVHIDLEYRLKAGDEIPLVESYLKLYPDELATPEMVVQLIVLEYQGRWRRDAGVEREEYLRRFPHYASELKGRLKPYRRCPHCRTSTEDVGSTVGSEDSTHPTKPLICPKCGRETPTGALPRRSREPSGTGPARLAGPTGGGEGVRSCGRPDWPTIPGYEIQQVLGQGGMGVVYKARQTGLQRLVALKMIQRGALARPEDLARFRQEAVAVAQLQHANIVQVYEIGEHEGRPFFSLELVEGGNLGQKLAGLPQPPDQAARLVETLARAVQAAHEHGIIHRDLKPANILLVSGGVVSGEWSGASSPLTTHHSPLTPKIADFGLAKQIHGEGDQTVSGIIIGTPRYMAPEQAAGRTKEIGPPVDVYGLGVILYEMVVGRPPFQGPSTTETLRQVVSEEAVSPRRLQPKVPRDLETICLKCLEKEPPRRYASAAALAEDLRRFQAREPIVARPVCPLQRAWRWCRRNPRVAVLVAAVALSLLAGTGAASYFAFHAAVQTREAQLGQERADRQEQLAREMERLRGLAEEQRAEADRGRAQARRYLYFSQINLAAKAWQEGRIARMDELLQGGRSEDANGEDFRGFEWYYLAAIRQRHQVTLEGHTDLVYGVAFSPDGRRLASGSEDRTVRIWDTASGRQLLCLQGRHTQPVTSVAYSPDGRYLASAAKNELVRIWDSATGRQLRTLEGGNADRAWAVAYSPDGRRLASAGPNGTLRVWDTTTWQEVLLCKAHLEPVFGVAFSPDGRRLGTAAADQTAKIWDAATGREIFSLTGHSGAVKGIAFSPDGRRLATAGSDHTVKLWDTATGKELLTLKGHTWSVTGVAFSPDGKRLASASQDRTVKLWDVTMAREIVSLKGHTDFLTGVAFSPDGQRLASASFDRTLKVWCPLADQEARTLHGHAGGVAGIAFNPDGQHLASASFDRTVKVWDTFTGREATTLRGHTAAVRSVAYSPDGQYLASGSADGLAKVWDAATGREVLSLKGHRRDIYCVAFSPEGRRLASAALDGMIKVWDITTGQEFLSLQVHPFGVRGVAFSPEGNRLASAGCHGAVQVWDAATGREMLVLLGHSHQVNSVTFSPDGRYLASASDDQTVRVWDASTARLVHTLKGHAREVDTAVFGPDGKRLASTSYDGRMKLWDVTTGQEILSFQAHTGRVTGLAFSSDGRRLASGAWDATVKIWDGTPRER